MVAKGIEDSLALLEAGEGRDSAELQELRAIEEAYVLLDELFEGIRVIDDELRRG